MLSSGSCDTLVQSAQSNTQGASFKVNNFHVTVKLQGAKTDNTPKENMQYVPLN